MGTVVYTDGACSGNPGPGGWAWANPEGPFASGFAPHTTNQRMEIQAAYEASMANPGPLEIVADSTYVINCFEKRWYEGWHKRGWLNASKQPVANRDLWEPFIDHVLERGDEISFRWVKGHSGDVMNDLVDALAVEAGKNQAARTGEAAPTFSKVKKGSAELPPGHLMLVTGHKPPALGGYYANPISDGVKTKLKEIIKAKSQMLEDLVVVTGLGLGAEQLGAEAAIASGVPFIAVLPFPNQEEVWPSASQEEYRKLLAKAQGQVLVQASKPATKQAAGIALGKRDAFLARNVAEAVIVWDGKDPQLEKTFDSLKEHLGETEVWAVSPA